MLTWTQRMHKTRPALGLSFPPCHTGRIRPTGNEERNKISTSACNASSNGPRTARLTKTFTPHADEIPKLTTVSSYDYHRIARRVLLIHN